MKKRLPRKIEKGKAMEDLKSACHQLFIHHGYTPSQISKECLINLQINNCEKEYYG